MITKWLSRLLLSAVVITSVACTNRLKEYQQVTIQATDQEEISSDRLEETTAILENRLLALGIELAEVKVIEPNQVVVRLPLETDAQAAEEVLTSTGQLSLRNQKPDTEKALASSIEDLQRLLVEQNTLIKTDKLPEAEALQPQIDETRATISDLFESGKLTGAALESATARRAAGDIWEVDIRFDEQGADLFAAQTKKMAGTGRAIGLFLDEVLLSAPVVDVAFAETGITGGEAVVSGNFTKAAARDLEIQLNSGALPITLETVEITSTEDAPAND